MKTNFAHISPSQKLFICLQVLVLLLVSFQTFAQNLADLGIDFVEIVDNEEKPGNSEENLLGGDGEPDKVPSHRSQFWSIENLPLISGVGMRNHPWPDLFLDVITPPPEYSNGWRIKA